jgi:hypothetical protein
MRIAYIILAHKLPEQLVRLVRTLNTASTSFFIHVDKKTDPQTYKRIVEPLSAYENVYFLKRHVIYYTDFNHLRAALVGLQKICSLGIQYDYVVLLTGQDYPLKSNKHIQKVLQEAKGNSYIEYFQLPSDEHWKNEDGGLDRVNYWYFHLHGRHIALREKNRFVPPIVHPLLSRMLQISPLRRKAPKNVKIFFGGSAYWCLARDCIDYVNDFVQLNSATVRFFKHVKIPEEIFFQTILLNSPFNTRLVNDNWWYVNWSTAHHPPVLRKKDFESFMSTNKIFARKFDITEDGDVLDMIDRVIL